MVAAGANVFPKNRRFALKLMLSNFALAVRYSLYQLVQAFYGVVWASLLDFFLLAPFNVYGFHAHVLWTLNVRVDSVAYKCCALSVNS